MSVSLPPASAIQSPRISPPEEAAAQPRALLYATSAGLGGSGLDSTSLEGVRASARGGFLRRVLCYPNRQAEIPRSRVRSLQMHPVRLLSALGSKDYYAAKKRWLDLLAARELKGGGFDFFHGWSGESFRALVEARLRGIPSVIDVPTWHRNKGIIKPNETKSERSARMADRGWRNWRRVLHTTRLQHLAEYDLATLLLMPSRKSAETFLAAGLPGSKLHYVGRGVDIERYRVADAPPDIFRVIFVGALIRRKGVHVLLEAWKRLNLPKSELVLLGSVHEEIRPALSAFAISSVKVPGFTSSVAGELRRSSVFAFPSECEGFAKATLEAAACGLPLIATHESGDAIVDGETGLMVPPHDVAALAAALEHAFAHRDSMRVMGQNARALVEREFTWDHYRRRILEGYGKAGAGK